MVLKYLEENGSITTYECYSKLFITRLSARIWDLKNKYGLDFEEFLLALGDNHKVMIDEMKRCYKENTPFSVSHGRKRSVFSVVGYRKR